MIKYRIIEIPAFEVIGKKTWISGRDNSLFGDFWGKCMEEGLFEIFAEINNRQPGEYTCGYPLGISRVEHNPEIRNFFYIIAIEKPRNSKYFDLEHYQVPSSQWVVFECWGKVPESIVKSEMYTFFEWLTASGYQHALVPEIEVYFPEMDGISDRSYCEFWLQIFKSETIENTGG
jgi:AraC family transcriptional regulator